MKSFLRKYSLLMLVINIAFERSIFAILIYELHTISFSFPEFLQADGIIATYVCLQWFQTSWNSVRITHVWMEGFAWAPTTKPSPVNVWLVTRGLTAKQASFMLLVWCKNHVQNEDLRFDVRTRRNWLYWIPLIA